MPSPQGKYIIIIMLRVKSVKKIYSICNIYVYVLENNVYWQARFIGKNCQNDKIVFNKKYLNYKID